MKDAVIALSMGGPDDIDSIKPFLTNLFNDRDLIDFRLGDFGQKILANLIINLRIKKSINRYMLMGGRSPQKSNIEKFMRKISYYYTLSSGRDIDCYIGMCYWKPFIEDVISAITSQEYKRIFLLPMYPQYSVTTSGVCFKRFANSYKGSNASIIKIKSFYNYLPYIERITELIQEVYDKHFSDSGNVHILFSAHSVPEYTLKAGDSYRDEVVSQVGFIMESFKNQFTHSISYQSKAGVGRWLGPSLEGEVRRLATLKPKPDIILVALSFINDHIETLVELDIELCSLAESLGIKLIRVQTLNDDDIFARSMSNLLLEHII